MHHAAALCMHAIGSKPGNHDNTSSWLDSKYGLKVLHLWYKNGPMEGGRGRYVRGGGGGTGGGGGEVHGGGGKVQVGGGEVQGVRYRQRHILSLMAMHVRCQASAGTLGLQIEY